MGGVGLRIVGCGGCAADGVVVLCGSTQSRVGPAFRGPGGLGCRCLGTIVKACAAVGLVGLGRSGLAMVVG